MRNYSKISEGGRSMVEMLGVLAIIGVLSVGGISGYSKAMAKFKASKAMDQLSILIANIRTAFATVADYGDLTNVNAKKYSIASRDMWQGGESSSGLVNAFGGGIVLSSHCKDGTGTDCATGFKISYSGLNPEACVQIATADWGTGGLEKINISAEVASNGGTGGSGGTGGTGGDSTTTNDGDFTLDAMPISLSEAYDKCGKKTATITWYFY